MPERINCIGVDPAARFERYKRTGERKKPSWIAHKAQSGWMTQPIDMLDMGWDDTRWLIDMLDKLRCSHGLNAMIIEGGFIGQMGESALKLENVRGQLRFAAKAAGLWVPEKDVEPKRWMEDITGQSIRIGHDELAKLWMLYAQDVSGLDGLCEDEAAAICIAEWANLQHDWER